MSDKLFRYSADRVAHTGFKPKPLYWSDDFEEVTGSDDGGCNRLATIEEVRRHQYPPLRPTEAFQVAEGLYVPNCIKEDRGFLLWEYVPYA